MTERLWKAFERRVATYLGGVRVPITGRQRGDVPDVRHPWLAIECKQRKELPDWILDAVRQAEACADPEQLPIAVLHQNGQRMERDLIVMRAQDFKGWFVGRPVNNLLVKNLEAFAQGMKASELNGGGGRGVSEAHVIEESHAIGGRAWWAMFEENVRSPMWRKWAILVRALRADRSPKGRNAPGGVA